MIDLNEKFCELEVLEKKILVIAKSNFEGSYEHWNILNTVNHAYCWKNSAIRKVELRIDGKVSKFHSDEPLETINRAFYDQTKVYTKKQTIEVMEETLKRVKILGEKIKGHELSKDLAPLGYKGDVLNYLIYDLLYHPVNHYIYYAIKNNEYEVFIFLEEYLRQNEKDLYADIGILSLKGLMETNEKNEIFIKGNEWENNALYKIFKENTNK